MPIRDVNEHSFGNVELLEVTLEPDVGVGDVISRILAIWSVHTVVDADFGRSVVEILREWVAEHGEPDLEAQLAPIVSA